MKSDTAAPWRRDRDWQRLYLGAGVSALGAAMLAFLAPLLVIRETASPHWGGVVGFALSALALVTGLPGGDHADRADRRRTMLVCSAVSGAACLIGAVATTAGASPAPVVVTCVGLSVVLSSWSSPAAGASVRSVVGRSDLAQAKALMQARAAVIRVVAAPLGGMLVGLSASWCLLLAGVAELVEFLAISRVPADRLLIRAADDAPTSAPGVSAGVAFVGRDPFLRGFLVFAAGSNLASLTLFTAANFFLVHRGVAPRSIGEIDGACGVTALLGAAVAPWIVARFEPVPLLVASSGAVCVGALAAAVSPTYLALLCAFPLSRLLLPAANASVAGHVFARVPDDMQGRLGASVGVCATALQPIAPLLAGFASGSRTGFAVGSVAAAATLALVTRVCVRSLRRAAD